jgi:hypothetical protein
VVIAEGGGCVTPPARRHVALGVHGDLAPPPARGVEGLGLPAGQVLGQLGHAERVEQQYRADLQGDGERRVKVYASMRGVFNAD